MAKVTKKMPFEQIKAEEGEGIKIEGNKISVKTDSTEGSLLEFLEAWALSDYAKRLKIKSPAVGELEWD